MTEAFVFGVLGLGAGVAYAALAYGVIVIYKGSGVLNFAQGAVAMVAAFCYVGLTDAGISKYIAFVIVIIGAAIFGAGFYLLVIRPLRLAPVLAKFIVTLGLLTAAEGFAIAIWGTQILIAPSLFPTTGVSLGAGAVVGVDRLYGLAGGVILTIVLVLLYGRTRFGVSTRAAAESEKGATLLGYSPDRIAATNWALGCGLGAVAGCIIAPITGLDTGSIPELILPALAAGLLGRFRSFWITGLVALAIGIVQSELTNYWSQPGVEVALPFVLVLAAMIVTGRLIPARGTLAEGRPPTTPAGRIPIIPALGAICVFVFLLVNLNLTYQSALATSAVFATLALSLVVITGYVGQISLAQMTFAGISGFALSKLSEQAGVPFPLSVILAAFLAVPVGVAVGLPALRVRGINLAIITLGIAYSFDAAVFQNPAWTGGSVGSQITSPEIAGFSFDANLHPVRFALLALGVFIVMAWLVSNLRQSSSGRKMLAVRSNERAAAAAGVSVRTVKLQAFALSSLIAGFGGAMLALSLGEATYSQFASSQSIALITLAYIGGIASIMGAAIAGFAVIGGFMYVVLSGISWLSTYYLMITGVLLIVVVLTQPDGGAPLMQAQIRYVKGRVAELMRRPRAVDGGDGSGPTPAEDGVTLDTTKV